jgi:hypothetical protein
MLTKSAFPFLINAPLTEITELVFPASKDTILRTVPAFSPHSTTLSPPIPDVLPGIGTTKSVSHALNTGLSMLTKSAFPFLINAPLTEMMELVFPASRDTILRTVPASSLHSTTLSPLILDVLPGIGTTKSVLHAQSNGLSTLIKSAFPFLINAPLTEMMELAFHASKDTISKKEPVFSPLSTTPSPLILDVLPGIGITKSAFHALKTGFSMVTRNVFQFPIIVLLMLIMETVSPASRDTISKKELASSPPSTMLILLILDVLPGIGTIKSAFHAPRDGSSTLKRDACPLMIIVTATMRVELALHASLDTP